MKRELFFLLLVIILVILWYQSKAVEAFQSNANPSVNVPKTDPVAAPIGEGDPKPFAPPSNALLAPPPGQMASVNSYPYDDPANKKAPLKQLKNTMETLTGFLTNEAAGLKTSADPAISLPLGTAESDLRRLQDEIAVMGRNPGIEGSLTIGDLNGINANLAFLQKKWRISANSVEGFQGNLNPLLDPGGPPPPSGLDSLTSNPCESGQVVSQTSTNGGNAQCVTIGSTCGNGGTYNSLGVCVGGTRGSGSGGSYITAAQLKTLQLNISAFITQLQNSGTVNAVITQRINTLTFLLGQVNDMLTKIEDGKMKESDIKIKLSDFKAFLPFVDINDPTTNMDNPLPHLLDATGASSALSNLFPYYFGGDISGAQLAQELFKKYASNLFTDVGYSINVNFNKKSDSERKVAEELANALANGTLGTNRNMLFSDTDNDGSSYGQAPPTSVTGMFNSIIQSLTGNAATDANTNTPTNTPTNTDTNTPTVASHFNWQDRSKEICDQITKRGLNAYDYGCLNNPDDVGDNFSYRGYAKMVCARLETNYDPSIPGLCGCPPPTWAGWRP